MQVIVDGMLTHYERQSQKLNTPTVLILPGWADTSRSWLKIQQSLSRNFDVIVLDIPGFGGTQPPQQAWGLNEYVNFVGQFLQKIGVTQLDYLVGHSNGGAMAIRAVSHKIISPRKLVLLASAGIRSTQNGRKLGLKIVAKTGKILTAPMPSSVRKKLRAKLYTASGSDLLVAEHMQDTFKRIVADDAQADAPQVSVPTLLVYGEQDQATPPAFGRTYQQLIPNATLKILPKSGHFLHVENTEEVESLLREFLA